MEAGLVLAALASVVMWTAVLWHSPPWLPRERLEPRPRPTVSLHDVDVIVPARNEADVLPHTLAALLRQGPGLRVFVVDDESSDATTAVAAEGGGPVHVLGIAVARHRALVSERRLDLGLALPPAGRARILARTPLPGGRDVVSGARRSSPVHS